jgi:CubicO group peptidase (beta-lactamase class C family)
MLLSHTSGLANEVPGKESYHDLDGPMVRWELTNQFNIPGLFVYLFPPSEERRERQFSIESGRTPDFWLFEPGTGYQYSNAGYYLLLGTIIEEVSGQSYTEYLQEHVFAPLEMTSTSYSASDYSQAQIAVPYEDFTESGRSDLPLTSFSASAVRTNAIDLSHFLLAHMNQGALGDRRILEPETVALIHERHRSLNLDNMLSKDANGVALGWFTYNGGYQGHGGGVPGILTNMLYSDEEDVPYGMVIMLTYGFSKIEADVGWANNYLLPIMDMLLEEGRAIAQGEEN